MKTIKLSATHSTNSVLKDMVKSNAIQNFTVLVTDVQTNGRGQTHTSWLSEPYKNLTYSVLCQFENLHVSDQKYLNFAVSLAVFETLSKLEVPDLSIKWPNDILSEKHKICGILIENTLKGSQIVNSIIGIGLNVNQEIFNVNIPNASSIFNKIGKKQDLDELLKKLILDLKEKIELLNKHKYQFLEDSYLSVMYKKNVPTMFVDSQNNNFMGKIVGVSMQGNLQIELVNETIKEFGLKEVSFLKL